LYNLNATNSFINIKITILYIAYKTDVYFRDT